MTRRDRNRACVTNPSVGGPFHDLPAAVEPPAGSHLITPRIGYVHHGIYVGDHRVVHYAGAPWALRHSVEEVPLARFSRKRSVFVRVHTAAPFDRQDVVERARSRLGEDAYRLLNNNCEHFCEWCVHGEHRSYQVERLLKVPRFFATLARRFRRAQKTRTPSHSILSRSSWPGVLRVDQQ
jgi:hypothetical protein